jgi:hypothetical protein
MQSEGCQRRGARPERGIPHAVALLPLSNLAFADEGEARRARLQLVGYLCFILPEEKDFSQFFKITCTSS